MKIYQKALALTATSTVALTLLIAPTAQALNPDTLKGVQFEPQNQCKDVQIITVAGTGEANSFDDPNFVYGLRIGENYSANVALDKPDNVSAWQLPYSGSVGAVGTIGKTRADAPLPYGLSRQLGVEKGLQHIKEVKQDCPNQKFIVTGFSQGAHVAGDIVAAINNGKVAGVSQDDIISAYLVSDPARSQVLGTNVTTSTGQVGRLSQNGELLITLNEGTPLGNEGATGPRDVSGQQNVAFKGMADKVMTFCHPNDIACSSVPGSLVQNIAKNFNSQTNPNHNYYQMGSEGLKEVDVATVMGIRLLPIVKSVVSGDAPKTERLVNQVTNHRLNKMTFAQREGMRALGQELTAISSEIHNYKGHVLPYNGSNLETKSNFLSFVAGDFNPKDPQQKKNLIPYLMNFFPHHLSYFTQNEIAQTEFGPWTAKDINAGSVTVDQWIENDINARVDAYLAGKYEPSVSNETKAENDVVTVNKLEKPSLRGSSV